MKQQHHHHHQHHPHHQHHHQNNSQNGSLSPLRCTDNNMGSSSSDLDVDSSPDMDTPENLSVKRDDSASQPDNVTPPPQMPSAIDNISLLRHYSKDYHNNFLLAQHNKQLSPSPNDDRNSTSPPRNTISPQPPASQLQHHHNINKPSTSPTPQRSPIDLLLRVFPSQKRNEVETLLQRNRGNIIQTMEALIYGNESNNNPMR